MTQESPRFTVAAVYWLDRRPVAYSLFVDRDAAAGARPIPGRRMTLETFAEALRLFPDLGRHGGEDDVPGEV